ncbi:MAG TPA: class I SAM-dependent methyltransferase [bacterium]
MPLDYAEDGIIVSPYSKLAGIYDDVMSHVDYKQWARYIQKVIMKWCPEATKILDISCGTGSLLAKFDSNRYRLFGFDLSFNMVMEAERKFHPLQIPILLWCGNMKSFRLKKNVDVVICLYDSINYLLNFEAWSRCFDCVFDSLNDQGIFIFDICTEKNSLKYFRNYIERKNRNQYQYLRASKYSSETNIHTNRFEIAFSSGSQKYVEIHQQYIFPVKDVLDFISKSKFEYLCAYDGFTFRSAHRNSLRIHFILKKIGT